MKEVKKMSRGYDAPGVDFFEREELPEFTPPANTIYGIVGVAMSGPTDPMRIESVRQLHSVFGYAYLGEDENGKKVISQAITAAERILEFSTPIIFCRVGLDETETAKFERKAEGKLSYKIANNDASIKAVKVVGDGSEVTISVIRKNRYGAEETSVLAAGIVKESDIKVALEFEGTLTDVVVPEGYIKSFSEETPEDVYALTVDPLKVKITNEFEYFENTDAVDVSVLIAPMGTVIEATKTGEDVQKEYDNVNNHLLAVASERKDCFVILDYPTDMGYSEFKALFSKQSYSGLDVDQAGTCYPAVKVKNVYTSDIVEASASMILSRQMAYTDNKKECWFAPAGFGDSKGVINDAVSVNVTLTKAQRKELYALRVNPVVNFVGQGIVLYGNRTFKMINPYEQESMYTQINVRRLVNYIRKIAIYVSIKTVFDPNDTLTWRNWENTISPKLREIKDNRGIEDYKVVMDRTTISDEDILNGRAPASIWVKPIGAIEYIPVNFVLTSDSTIFEDEVGGEV